MPNTVTNQLQMTVLSTEDSTNNVLVNRSIAPLLDEHVAHFMSYAKVGVGLQQITFPQGFTIATKVYIRNLGAVGAGSIGVSWQPVGTPLSQAGLLGPGDVLVYWQAGVGSPAIVGFLQGIAEVFVQGSVADIPFEYFVGA